MSYNELLCSSIWKRKSRLCQLLWQLKHRQSASNLVRCKHQLSLKPEAPFLRITAPSDSAGGVEGGPLLLLMCLYVSLWWLYTPSRAPISLGPHRQLESKMNHEALPLVNHRLHTKLGNSCKLLVWWRLFFLLGGLMRVGAVGHQERAR